RRPGESRRLPPARRGQGSRPTSHSRPPRPCVRQATRDVPPPAAVVTDESRQNPTRPSAAPSWLSPLSVGRRDEDLETELVHHAAFQERFGHGVDHADERFDRLESIPEHLRFGGALSLEGGNPLAQALEHRIPLPALARLDDVPDGL